MIYISYEYDMYIVNRSQSTYLPVGCAADKSAASCQYGPKSLRTVSSTSLNLSQRLTADLKTKGSIIQYQEAFPNKVLGACICSKSNPCKSWASSNTAFSCQPVTYTVDKATSTILIVTSSTLIQLDFKRETLSVNWFACCKNPFILCS